MDFGVFETVRNLPSDMRSPNGLDLYPMTGDTFSFFQFKMVGGFYILFRENVF